MMKVFVVRIMVRVGNACVNCDAVFGDEAKAASCFREVIDARDGAASKNIDIIDDNGRINLPAHDIGPVLMMEHKRTPQGIIQ